MATCNEAISSFRCAIDPDIEYFLKNRAVKYNQVSKGRTFLLLGEEALMEGKMAVLAYFTITLTIMHVPSGFSGNQIKKLDGLSSTYHGERLTEFPCYLIGQLAKNDEHVADITGDEVIAHAMGIVAQANSYTGGRYVLVDVKPVDKLIEYYHRNSFEMFDESPDAEQNAPMVQMFRKIY